MVSDSEMRCYFARSNGTSEGHTLRFRKTPVSGRKLAHEVTNALKFRADFIEGYFSSFFPFSGGFGF